MAVDISDLVEERKDKINVIYPGSVSDLPVLAVRGRTIAEAWETSIVALYQYGIGSPTQYDKALDPHSREARMTMVIDEPLEHPILHCVTPGGPAELEEYRQEVVEGIKDFAVRNHLDPADERWEYTYHERLFRYKVPSRNMDQFLHGLPEEDKALFRREMHDDPSTRDRYKRIILMDQPFVDVADDVVENKGRGWRVKDQMVVINQIEYVAQKLADQYFSRQAQAITWQPWLDTSCYDPACLQRLWFKIYPDTDDVWHLNMDIEFRSRDSYKAALMNLYALSCLDKVVAERIAHLAGREVVLGRITDTSNSYHLYGYYFGETERQFFKSLRDRKSLTERTIRKDIFDFMSEDAKPQIAQKVEQMRRNRQPR